MEQRSSRHLAFIGGTSEPGGLHIHTADVAQACAALGYRVTIICTSVNYYARLITDTRVAIVVVPPLQGHGLSRWAKTWRTIARSCGGADLVICRGRFAETRLADLMAARYFGRRVYTIEHRPWEGEWRSILPKTMIGRMNSRLVYRSIGVSSEIAQSAVNDFSFPTRKVATCLNWVAPEFTQRSERERMEARAALGVPPGMTLVCYMGRLAPEKRVDELLRAFAAIPSDDDTLLLIGGDGWKRTSLVEQARQLGIDRRVRFTGWTTDPRPLLAACDLAVLPSLVEGFPLALMEAMGVGCLCLAHPMASTEELIADGSNGLLADLSHTESFAAALARGLAQDRQSRETLGRRAAETIASRFSRERRLPELLAALDCPIDAKELPAMRPRKLSFAAP